MELAKMAHQHYLDYIEKNHPNWTRIPWEELTEDLKYSNIRQIEKIEDKLEYIGAYITKDPGDATPLDSFSDEDENDDRETLSKLEHQYWIEEREESGWVYGPKKNKKKKISPYMVPWDDLSEDVRNLDRNSTDFIIPALKKFNIFVIKSTTSERKEEPLKYYKEKTVPLILSVTGHTDVPNDSKGQIEKCLDELLEKINRRYANTDKILLSGLAEGADRTVAEWALANNIKVAPILPMPIEKYMGTFSGTGYGMDDIEAIVVTKPDDIKKQYAEKAEKIAALADATSSQNTYTHYEGVEIKNAPYRLVWRDSDDAIYIRFAMSVGPILLSTNTYDCILYKDNVESIDVDEKQIIKGFLDTIASALLPDPEKECPFDAASYAAAKIAAELSTSNYDAFWSVAKGSTSSSATIKEKGRINLAKEESKKKFRWFLDQENVFTPQNLDDAKTNRSRTYRDLAAYLVANSHIMISIWDGRTYGISGGTYDTIRMAIEGIDQDLINKMPPTAVAPGFRDPDRIPSLNAAEDTLVYWIETDRTCDWTSLKEDKMCHNVDRTPGDCHGFIFKKEMQVQHNPENKGVIDQLWSVLKHKDKDYHPDSVRIIDSGKIFDNFDKVYCDIPQEFDGSFRKIDELNKDIKNPNVNKRGIHKDGLFPPDFDESTNEIYTKCATDIRDRFFVLDSISRWYKQISKRNTLILAILQCVATGLFSTMVLFDGSSIFTILYGVAILVLTLLLHIHKEKKEHAKYVEYRALAESLRVQYYWGICGINDSVSLNCYGYLKNGMSWMRLCLTGLCSAAANDYSPSITIPLNERIAFTEKYWIEEKEEYLSTKERGKLKKSRIYSKVITFLQDLSLVFAVVLMFMSLAMAEWSSAVIREFSSIVVGEYVLLEAETITRTVNMKLLIIIVTFVLSMFVAFKSQTFASRPEESEAKKLMYEMTRSKLRKVRSSKGTHSERINGMMLDILHELGSQEINHNNDWVFEFLDKDFKKRRNGSNIKNVDEPREHDIAEVDM